MDADRFLSLRTYESRVAIRFSLLAHLFLVQLTWTSAGLWAAPASQSTNPSPESSTALSSGFLRPATSALVALHQAKQNIADVVTKNLPIGYYNPNFAAQAYDQVRQSQIAAKTSGDQNAANLLNSYFTKVKTWAEKYKAARQSLNATNTMGGPDMLKDDPDWQAIESCEKDLNTMLGNRVYNDIASCH